MIYTSFPNLRITQVTLRLLRLLSHVARHIYNTTQRRIRRASHFSARTVYFHTFLFTEARMVLSHMCCRTMHCRHLSQRYFSLYMGFHGKNCSPRTKQYPSQRSAYSPCLRKLGRLSLQHTPTTLPPRSSTDPGSWKSKRPLRDQCK